MIVKRDSVVFLNEATTKLYKLYLSSQPLHLRVLFFFLFCTEKWLSYSERITGAHNNPFNIHKTVRLHDIHKTVRLHDTFAGSWMNRTLVAVYESGLITGWEPVSNFAEVLAGWKASSRKKERALPITKIKQPFTQNRVMVRLPTIYLSLIRGIHIIKTSIPQCNVYAFPCLYYKYQSMNNSVSCKLHEHVLTWTCTPPWLHQIPSSTPGKTSKVM
jgi:hypothetical protein